MRSLTAGDCHAPCDPASAFSSAAARSRLRENDLRLHRPCGFTPCEYEAVKLDERMNACGFARCRRAVWTRRLNTCIRNVVHLLIVRASMSRRIRFIHALANDPSHQAPPLHSFAARCRSCIDAFPLARCSATDTASLRGLARADDPSVIPRAALLGFIPFAGLFPHWVSDHL